MTELEYPQVERDDTTEVLHGRRVEDPYRYLEDPNSKRTEAFVAAQNAVSEPYLAGLEGRSIFAELTRSLLLAPRAGVPWYRGGRYLRLTNPGDLDQDILCTADTLEDLLAGGRVLLDPNTLSSDGAVALAGARVSGDGKYLAYALAEAGSDWTSFHVRDIGTGLDLPDVIHWCKFSVPVWMPDSSGFLYWCYPAPEPGTEFTEAMGAGRLMLHRLGTAVSEDLEIWSRPEDPELMAGPDVAHDGTWLVLTIGAGSDSRTMISALRIGADDEGRRVPVGPEIPVVAELTHAQQVVEIEGDALLLRTETGAGRGRLVSIDLADVAGPMTELIGEHPTDVLASASRVGDGVLVVWSHDAAHRVEVFDTAGHSVGTLDLAGPLSVAALTGEPGRSEFFYGTTSFAQRLEVFRAEITGPAVSVESIPSPAGNPVLPATVSRREFAVSTDGTRVPMTVVHRADLPPGPQPTLLYGYGGFDIPLTPSFSALFASWVAAGGVVAVANLRGGGEFGTEWHQQGMLANKQQVFDDAIRCAQHLFDTGVTTAGQLAVHGRSNGGLLVGALMTQRPDLFAAAVPSVGVLDMLRYHLFTIGWAWVPEYGSAADPEAFDWLRAYSPLHNVRAGVEYPATLICTGDHDDRVVPAHSLKFGAELQHTYHGERPILLRIDTRAGHGAGKPATALAAEYTDVLAFIGRHTGLT
ncbi:S9 family peptidase [Nakamurella silvestris]|nr:S9 family peptidase [Nakamurella silvestris]